MTEDTLFILKVIGCFVFAALTMLEADNIGKPTKLIIWLLCFISLAGYTLFSDMSRHMEKQRAEHYEVESVWSEALSIGKVGDDTLKYYTDCKNSTRKQVDTNCLASTITLLEADGYSDEEIKATLDATKQISTNLKLLGDN